MHNKTKWIEIKASGDTGSGKTLALDALSKQMANTGGYMVVHVPSTTTELAKRQLSEKQASSGLITVFIIEE